MVRLKYDVTVQDYEALSVRAHQAPTMRGHWWRHLAAQLAVWVLVYASLAAWIRTVTEEAFASVGEIVVALGVVALIVTACVFLSYLIHPWRVRRLARKMIGSDPQESFLGPQELDADAGGVTLEGGGVRAHYEWSAIKRLAETATHLFLMTGRIHGIIVPKRELDPSALTALRELVSASIANRPQ